VSSATSKEFHVERWPKPTAQLKHQLGPMDGLRTIGPCRRSSQGMRSRENLRRGHDKIAVEVPCAERLTMAFTELAPAV
jgi:hypothetical protein